MIDPSEVTVITATIPGREGWMAECAEAVKNQTVAPAEHLVFFDTHKRGIQAAMNWLWPRAKTPWVQWVADDDLLLPNHLARVTELADPADIVHAYCEVQGRPGFNPNYTAEASGYNMTATALMRVQMIRELGGWDAEAWPEDMFFWRKAGAAGYRFDIVDDEITWIYRFHDGNASIFGASR